MSKLLNNAGNVKPKWHKNRTHPIFSSILKENSQILQSRFLYASYKVTLRKANIIVRFVYSLEVVIQ